jgi:hypothetical protein
LNKNKIVVIFIILLFFIGLSGCTGYIKPFTIKAKFSYIKSNPNGGGVFIIKLIPRYDFSDNVSLLIDSDELLNPQLTQCFLNENISVSELELRPDRLILPGIYNITLIASNNKISHEISLKVEIINITTSEPSIQILEKRDEFIEYLHSEYPDMGNFSNQDWYSYMTYPGIIVVEHWTFLSREYEMRMCYHATIPPHNWSKIRLRPRGDWNPIFAAVIEFDGRTYEIPVSEYPIMFGY